MRYMYPLYYFIKNKSALVLLLKPFSFKIGKIVSTKSVSKRFSLHNAISFEILQSFFFKESFVVYC